MAEESKYSAYARGICRAEGARAVILLVIGGHEGNGCARVEEPFTDGRVDAEMRAAQVRVLRHLADDIERGITQPDQPWARRGQG